MCQVLRVLAVLCVGGLVAGVSPAFGVFPGGNGRIAFERFSEGDIDVWTMRPNGSSPINLTANSAAFDADFYPNWSPDGRKIAFTSNRGPDAGFDESHEIFVMNADGSNQTQLTFNGLNDQNPAWSPDGRRIVFERDLNPLPDEFDFDLFTMDASGRNQRNLTNTPGAEDREANWSPNGRKIAFSSNRSGDFDVHTIHANGSDVQRLTVVDGFDGGSNWSPDGRMIAFDSERDGNVEVYKMRADGSRQTRLTFNAAADLLAAWSPDGRRIAFTTDRDITAENPDNFEVYTMRADGRHQVNRTNNPTYDARPDWQPLPDDHDGDEAPTDASAAPGPWVLTAANRGQELRYDVYRFGPTARLRAWK